MYSQFFSILRLRICLAFSYLYPLVCEGVMIKKYTFSFLTHSVQDIFNLYNQSKFELTLPISFSLTLTTELPLYVSLSDELPQSFSRPSLFFSLFGLSILFFSFPPSQLSSNFEYLKNQLHTSHVTFQSIRRP